MTRKADTLRPFLRCAVVVLCSLALPLAVSAYARTSLTTLEHLLIPRGLKSSGLTADRALAGYGTVHGMALPVVILPS